MCLSRHSPRYISSYIVWLSHGAYGMKPLKFAGSALDELRRSGLDHEQGHDDEVERERVSRPGI